MRDRLTVQILGLLLIGLGFFWPAAISAAPGDLDSTFAQNGWLRETVGVSGRDEILGTALQADGKIVAVGLVFYGDSLGCGIARYNPDGSFDASFDGDGQLLTLIGRSFECHDVALQADGKIVAAGFIRTNQNYDFAVVRYNTDGSPDLTFDGDGKVITDLLSGADVAYAVAIQGDGKIVVVGRVSGVTDDFAVLRYNPTGSLDTSFDGDGIVTTDVLGSVDHARAVAIQADGKIIVAGNSSVGTLTNDFAVVRYNPDGSLDTSFDGDGKATTDILGSHDNVNAIAIQADGKVVAAGQSSTGNIWEISLVRYNANGTLDASFDNDGKITTTTVSNFNDYVYEVAIQSDGKIVAAGSSTGSNGGFAVLRYNPTGSLDTSFDGDGIVTTPVLNGGGASAMAIQADGKIVAAGSATAAASNNDFAVVRYNPTGTLDTSFDGDGKKTNSMGSWYSSAQAVAIQADGKIVVVGNGYNGADVDFGIARYNPDGSLDTSFDGDGRVTTDFLNYYDSAYAVAIQADGKIVVGGQASGGSAISRYNPDGSLDTSFDGDGKITIDISPFDSISDIAIQADGKIVTAGTSSTSFRNDITIFRFNQNGSFDTSFDGDGIVTTDFLASDDYAGAIAIQADGKIVVAGTSSTDSESSDFALVRYNPNGSLDPSFDGDGKILTDFSGTIDGATDMAIQADGKIVAVGVSSSGFENFDFALVRYNSSGALDASFDGDGKVVTPISNSSDYPTGVAIQADGKIITAGHARNLTEDFALVRYNGDGSLDSSYGTGGKAVFDLFNDDMAWGLALDSTGRAVIVGESGSLFTVVRVLGGFVSSNTPFDFDGDRKTDISIFRPGAGEWWYQRSSDGQPSAAQFGNSTDKIVPADFSGDGKTDIAVFRPATGEWLILRSENGSFYSVPFGISTDLPAPADYDGDGRADLAVFRPSAGTWFISKSSGGTLITAFGQAGDVPAIGDYDGDGLSDIAIYRPSTGEWWINRSTAGVITAQFGASADKPVPGDWTGDGKTDIAFYRPSTGEWFILRSENGSFYSVPFGAAGDIPTAGDYDGDGKFDTAVFRPASSTWYVNRSTAGLLIQQFGLSTDRPVPAAFVP